jgi:hypothetical protein
LQIRALLQNADGDEDKLEALLRLKERKAAGGNIHIRHMRLVTEIEMLKIVLHVMRTHR